jgi:hypothetical protein
MAMQIAALLMLTVSDAWLGVAYVMFAQALSGIANDLSKMSAKAGVKPLSGAGGESKLLHYGAVLTGSINALKGVGFFPGAALLDWIGFRMTLVVLASKLAIALRVTAMMLPTGVGKLRSKPKFSPVFSNKSEIDWLSAARLFPSGARCLVRCRSAGVPLLGIGLVFCRGRQFLFAVGYRLRLCARVSPVVAAALTPRPGPGRRHGKILGGDPDAARRHGLGHAVRCRPQVCRVTNAISALCYRIARESR